MFCSKVHHGGNEASSSRVGLVALLAGGVAGGTGCKKGTLRDDLCCNFGALPKAGARGPSSSEAAAAAADAEERAALACSAAAFA